MKILKLTTKILMLFLVFNLSAQETANQKGLMNATVTHTFAYEKDGVQRPYTVTIREKRTSAIKFDNADLGKVNQDRVSTPEKVAILIGIKNPNDPSDDRIIALRYDKKINDTFDIESTQTGFIVDVSGKKMRYTIGEGLSFENSSDEGYFSVDEFDVVE